MGFHWPGGLAKALAPSPPGTWAGTAGTESGSPACHLRSLACRQHTGRPWGREVTQHTLSPPQVCRRVWLRSRQAFYQVSLFLKD